MFLSRKSCNFKLKKCVSVLTETLWRKGCNLYNCTFVNGVIKNTCLPTFAERGSTPPSLLFVDMLAKMCFNCFPACIPIPTLPSLNYGVQGRQVYTSAWLPSLLAFSVHCTLVFIHSRHIIIGVTGGGGADTCFHSPAVSYFAPSFPPVAPSLWSTDHSLGNNLTTYKELYLLHTKT